MADAIAVARTGLDAAQERINTLAQNAANASSVAYKERMLITTDNFYTTLKKGGLAGADSDFAAPSAIQRGSGSKISGVTKNLTQGAKKDTNNPFHIYIDGGGYFAVQLPNNRIGYTRGGVFKKRADGRLVTEAHGYELINNEVTIPDNVDPQKIKIRPNGEVVNSDNNEVYATIQLATFSNELGLEEIGGGVLVETDASGEALIFNPGEEDSVGSLTQGGYETSNVSQIEALTGLIDAQRAFELNLKIVAAQNEILKNTNETFK